MKIPKLRFKEFSGEWEEKRLGDIGKIISGGTPDSSMTDYWNGDIQWFTPTEVGKKKYVNKSMRRITKLGLEKSSAKLLPKGTILLSTRATIGIKSIASSEVTTNQGFQSILVNEKNDNEFIYYLLDTLIPEMKKIAFGTTFLEISGKALGKIEINLPNIEEQEKIANFLSSVDKKISIAEEKLNLFREYKKGMMQKIFKQEIRFKDENGNNYPDWVEKRLGEISSVQTGNKDLEDKKENGIYPFFVRSKNIERIDTYSYDGEAILIPGDGKIGEVYHYINGKFDYHQRVYKISGFENICCKYIYYYLYEKFKKHALTYTAKATVDSLRLPVIKEFVIKLPCLEEQEKIANFLSSIDNKIENLSNELENLKEFKKGLLQKMFI